MNNLWETFSETAQRMPQRAAIVANENVHSFSELTDRVKDFRVQYQLCRLKSHDRVLLWMENNFEMAAALVACWAQDAIPVLIDASCREPQMHHALELVKPRIIVHSRALPGTIDNTLTKALHTEEVPVCQNVVGLPEARALPTDPASIVFTSGSTGMPKGVVQSQRNILLGCATVFSYLGLRESDTLLCPVPWSFDYGYGQLLSTLLKGVTHVIPRLNNPSGICEAVEQHRPTVLAGTPSVFSYLMGGMSPIGSTDISGLRLLTSTGGKITRAVLDAMLDAFSEAETVLNYGLTETYRSCYLPPHLLRSIPESLGIAIPGVGIEILRDDGSRASPNEEGEIVHRGNLVCLGYWNNPESSAAAIRRDPITPSGVISSSRSVYTGDIGFADEDGFLYFVGRRDRLIKSMGVRVSPHEVEEVLVKSGQIEAAAVFGRRHDLLGHEIHAAVVPKDPKTFDQKALQKFARQNMSQFMLPRNYLVLEELPKTTSGKTDYRALEIEGSPKNRAT